MDLTFRNMWHANPDTKYLLSRPTRKYQHKHRAMGRNLAREVSMFIARTCLSSRKPQKLRRPYCTQHRCCDNARGANARAPSAPRILSSRIVPHLGTVLSQSFLVPTGMWFMKRFKKSTRLSSLVSAMPKIPEKPSCIS